MKTDRVRTIESARRLSFVLEWRGRPALAGIARRLCDPFPAALRTRYMDGCTLEFAQGPARPDRFCTHAGKRTGGWRRPSADAARHQPWQLAGAGGLYVPLRRQRTILAAGDRRLLRRADRTAAGKEILAAISRRVHHEGRYRPAAIDRHELGADPDSLQILYRRE